MMNEKLKGGLYVALGASSYAMLTTCVKMAYREGFSTAEITLSQYILGALGLLFLNLLGRKAPITNRTPLRGKTIFKLIAAGSSLGLTSAFLYSAVKYVSVSVGIVLLMQTVWMGVIVEMVIYKRPPGTRKIVAILIILTGTALATTLYRQTVQINWIGFGWGILAAMSYTATMYSSNHVAVDFPPLMRSLYMIIGGLIVIIVIFHAHITCDFSFRIFLGWGIILSLFGTILPPILFTRGMPLIGMGLGAIIASVEIPVSVSIAFVLIDERVSAIQWMGVILILLAVILMNFGKT